METSNLFQHHSYASSPTLLPSFQQFNHTVAVNLTNYYTTQAVRGPITKINQSKCSIAGPIFSKYWTGHCPEWSRTCVFAFFSRVISLLLTKREGRTGRISALGLFRTDLAALGPYCQDLGPIFSQYGPRAWLIRYIYTLHKITLTLDAVLPVGIISVGTMGSTQLPSCRHKGHVNSPFLGL